MSPGRRGGRGQGGGGGEDDFPNIPLPDMPGPPAGQGDTPPPTGTGSVRPTTTQSGAALPQLPPDAHTPTFREKVFGFVTGRRGAVGSSSGDVTAQLISAYGTSRRDPTRPDTAAAAKALNVSQRTVQRWVKGGGLRPDHAKKVETQARQAMTTKRGRARAMKAAKATGASDRPPGKNAITIGGVQGAQSSIDENYRDRDTSVRVTDDDIASLQDLWVEHGSEGAADWLHAHYDEHYVEDWHFTDVEDIDWGTSSNY